jgi:hypothetical protein
MDNNSVKTEKRIETFTKAIFLGRTFLCPESNLKKGEIVLITKKNIDPAGLYCFVTTLKGTETASVKQLAIVEKVEIEWERKPFMTWNQELVAQLDAVTAYLRKDIKPETSKKHVTVLDYSEPSIYMLDLEFEQYPYEIESEAIERKLSENFKMSEIHYMISEKFPEVKYEV